MNNFRRLLCAIALHINADDPILRKKNRQIYWIDRLRRRMSTTTRRYNSGMKFAWDKENEVRWASAAA